MLHFFPSLFVVFYSVIARSICFLCGVVRQLSLLFLSKLPVNRQILRTIGRVQHMILPWSWCRSLAAVLAAAAAAHTFPITLRENAKIPAILHCNWDTYWSTIARSAIVLSAGVTRLCTSAMVGYVRNLRDSRRFAD